MEEFKHEECGKRNVGSRVHSRDPRIIIIGAGAAGIAAATRLLENNMTNLIILEAEGRVGGRIYTTTFESSTVDLGAQFCHGKDGNVVYEMVKDLDLLESEFGKILYTPYHSSRKELDPVFLNELFNIFEDIFYEEKNNYKKSFGEYMLQRSQEIVRQKYGDDIGIHTTFMEALNTYKLDLIANEGPFSWYDVAATEDYEECDGDKLQGWKGRGFETILDILTKKYPDPSQSLPLDTKINLNKKVTKVYWGNDSSTVCCGDEFYTADHVIFTPSLGVLKQHWDTLFEPKLSEEKIQAITTIGIGSTIKVLYYFPVVWWPDDSRDFTFVWSNEDRDQVANEFPDAVLTNGKSWLLNVLQLIRIANGPNILGAWICGETVPEVELLSDEAIINGTMFLINKFLGHLFPNCPRPEKILRENWYTNQNFLGAYSYQTIESRDIPGDSQEVVLAKPIPSRGVPKLLFAGEATSPTHYGTVHGAIETGWREADRLIKLYGGSSKREK